MELLILVIVLPIGCVLMHWLTRWTERRDMRAAVRETALLMRTQDQRCPRRPSAPQKETDGEEQ
ncbi:MAG: hypothetical protein K2X78_01290 [Burkholderiaceae bacterium]|nr:hypothetical protein [Burkholderiaceae bacterium]